MTLGSGSFLRIVRQSFDRACIQFGCLSARIRINPGPEGALRAHPAARLGNRLGRHDAVAVADPGGQDSVVA